MGGVHVCARTFCGLARGDGGPAHASRVANPFHLQVQRTPRIQLRWCSDFLRVVLHPQPCFPVSTDTQGPRKGQDSEP